MPVDTQHAEYRENKEYWLDCRTCFEGEDEVKEAGPRYLPMLTGQEDSEYEAYLMRAMFFSVTARTVQGLAGAVFRKEPKITFPESKKDMLSSITRQGSDFLEFAKESLTEVITIGRIGILVDLDESEGSLPYLTAYRAEDCVNWSTIVVGGREVLNMVVLREFRGSTDPTDEFEIKLEEIYRVLKLQDGVYIQEIWVADSEEKTKKKWKLGETINPKILGKSITYIPFVFCNASSTKSGVEKPPIVDLVNVNLSHYRTSADLEHGQHFTALPTAWVAGFPPKTKLTIGSAVAWVSDDPNAHAGFLEFTGAGLGALRSALESKERLMAVLGSRLLEEQKASAEAAETVKLRQSGENSVLTNIALSLGHGLEKALKWILEFTGVKDGEVEVKLNLDYITQQMPADQLTALMAAWQSGGISYNSFFYNLKRGEYIPEDRTAEEEMELINSSPPPMIPNSIPDSSAGAA